MVTAGVRHIEITIHGCRDLPKVQLVGKQDPYVVVRYGGQEFVTHTHNNGNRNPVFNQTFSFVVTPGCNTAEFRVMDKNLGVDAFIASGRVDFIGALDRGIQGPESIPLKNSWGTHDGSLQLTLKCPEAMMYGSQVATPAHGGYYKPKPQAAVPPYGAPPAPSHPYPAPQYPPQYTHLSAQYGAAHPSAAPYHPAQPMYSSQPAAYSTQPAGYGPQAGGHGYQGGSYGPYGNQYGSQPVQGHYPSAPPAYPHQPYGAPHYGA